MKNYKPIERTAITTDYKGYKVITMGPPSGGGVTLIQMFNILENISLIKMNGEVVDIFIKLVDTMKYSFADRSKHIGDPDFYDVPIDWLLSKKYAKDIFGKIE